MRFQHVADPFAHRREVGGSRVGEVAGNHGDLVGQTGAIAGVVVVVDLFGTGVFGDFVLDFEDFEGRRGDREGVVGGEIDRQFADRAAVVIALNDRNAVIAPGNGVVAVAGDDGIDSRNLGQRIEFVQFRHAVGLAWLGRVGHGRQMGDGDD